MKNDDAVYNVLVADHVYKGNDLSVRTGETVFFAPLGILAIAKPVICCNCVLDWEASGEVKSK